MFNCCTPAVKTTCVVRLLPTCQVVAKLLPESWNIQGGESGPRLSVPCTPCSYLQPCHEDDLRVARVELLAACTAHQLNKLIIHNFHKLHLRGDTLQHLRNSSHRNEYPFATALSSCR